MQRSNNDELNRKSNNLTSFLDLETTSASSSSSSSTADMETAPAIEIPESESENDLLAETDYDEKISGKERAIREVDLYLTKLQDRRKQLVDECNKLKDEKALRQSNKLAKQNWDSGEFGDSSNGRKIVRILFGLWFQMHFHGIRKFNQR